MSVELFLEKLKYPFLISSEWHRLGIHFSEVHFRGIFRRFLSPPILDSCYALSLPASPSSGQEASTKLPSINLSGLANALGLGDTIFVGPIYQSLHLPYVSF